MSRGQPALLGAQLEEELTRVNVYEPQDTILSQKPQALYRDWQGSLERPLLLHSRFATFILRDPLPVSTI